eukprot:CAMPEP_0181331210 /NCGR_PEP_ID=MMETSP1101-20121128/24370_1 /TAXON_ID=46948 /ORGANISM="Rhodomonas abbreviata, Strain Caron Lab Isolate" /LENGTH=124 /DNA_ID=CAMNT_0023440635 /DNA_START=113 /DNA_END=483 /DNA_ORIENTATION=-
MSREYGTTGCAIRLCFALVLLSSTACAADFRFGFASPCILKHLARTTTRNRPSILSCSAEILKEGEVSFNSGGCFYRPHSKVVRDLGVLEEGNASFVLANDANDDLRWAVQDNLQRECVRACVR